MSVPFDFHSFECIVCLCFVYCAFPSLLLYGDLHYFFYFAGVPAPEDVRDLGRGECCERATGATHDGGASRARRDDVASFADGDASLRHRRIDALDFL